MVEIVERAAVLQLIASHRAQLVEVLPRPEYEWAHLPGAVHLHLKELDADSAAALDTQRPVITYCNNTECDMSPRAAVRLQRLGLRQVYDYAGGKMDWLSFGLPFDGNADLVGNHLDRDVPTCPTDTTLAALRERLGREAQLCVVTDDHILQGILTHDALHHQPGELTAEQAMTFGVSTVRPSEEVKDLNERMRRRRVALAIVTSSDGRLLGTYTPESG
ncbi:rhodanese-like domain-containing protein [Allorhizocola rhizosphaerae]|uniref:rhodanese-like domain-containing protein n=1 Tax=Allorhizocola rhizosphaerae TaxID=1872709 RepID=UPI000E3C462D|nr:rhodanese-like domain-containing protein [Allorhizocola rhizosphaerae]